jgi:SAM-dependent methyltransferase
MSSPLFPSPFEVGVEEALAVRPFPAASPFAPSSSPFFAREDDGPDADSTVMPRLCRPFDEAAVYSLTLYLEEVLGEYTDASASRGVDVLDLCAGWLSHLPDSIPYGRVTGVGLNEYELERNGRLDDRVLLDVNGASASLPLPDASVDVVTLTAAVDILARPLELFAEALRVTRPGGSIVVAFSRGPAASTPAGKVTALWRGLRTDAERVWAAAALLHYSGGGAGEGGREGEGGWAGIEAWDLSPSSTTDALFVVRARKPGGEGEGGEK